jgi:hypothetical protein
MELSDYWGALVRGWWLIVIFAVGGLVVGLSLPTFGKTTQTQWQSTSSFGSPPPANPQTGGSNIVGGSISPDQLLYYANTDQVMTWTQTLSHVNESIQVIRANISLLGPPTQTGQTTPSSGQPGVIDVKVTAPTTAEALSLNSSFDEAMAFEVASVTKAAHQSAISQIESTLARVLFQDYTGHFPFGVTREALQIQINQLQNYLAFLTVQQPNAGFDVVQAPEAVTVTKVTTTSTLSKRPVRAAAGLGIGLILGVLAALALWLLDKRLKTAKRAQAAFAYPVVAEIPPDSSDATEPYRMLWLSVFREPLPLPPAEQNKRLYEGEDPVLEAGVGGRSGQAESP